MYKNQLIRINHKAKDLPPEIIDIIKFIYIYYLMLKKHDVIVKIKG